VGLALLIISGTMLIFSLFINLPFRKTYVTTTEPGLVTSGLYSLVRHPWVISLSLLLVSLVFVSRSRDLLIATPVWISLAILSTVLKDRFLFGRMFGGYEAYRRETPMLLPNRKSITAFINGLRGDTSFRRLHTNE
jgi:protein-S-isoprenylcysteine O-methyltransferase Ste14